MTIQSFVEKYLSVIDEDFANEANKLLNEARQQTVKTPYIAGYMDGLNQAAIRAKETYALFFKSDSDDETEEKSLY